MDDPVEKELIFLRTQTTNAEIKKFLQRQINARSSVLARQKESDRLRQEAKIAAEQAVKDQAARERAAAARPQDVSETEPVSTSSVAKPQMMDISKLGIKMPPKRVKKPQRTVPDGKKIKITSYSWEETETKLKFRLNNIGGFTESDANLQNIYVDIQRCDISIVVHHAGCNHTLEIENLVGDLEMNETPLIKIKPNYVLISISKDYPRLIWSFLTEEEREQFKKKHEKIKEKQSSQAAGHDNPLDGMRQQIFDIYDECDEDGKKKMNQMLAKAKETKTLDPMKLGLMMKEFMVDHEKSQLNK